MRNPELEFLKTTLLTNPMDVAVETGTLLGDSTVQLAEIFERVFSIELSSKLYDRARQRFEGVSRIHLIQGDSSKVICMLSKEISGPCFWYLDAHWYKCNHNHPVSDENPFPLWDEIDAIRQRPYADLIFIDDVHCFGRDSGDIDSQWKDVSTQSIVNRFGDRCERSLLVDDVFVVFMSAA